MRILCAICADVLHKASSALSTPCGHAYHSNCLMLWLNRSETCPYCRNPVTHETVFKLHLDVTPTTSHHSAKSENEISNLEAELNAKIMELNTLQAEKEALVSKNRLAELQVAVDAVKGIIADFNTIVSCNDIKIINGTQEDADENREVWGSEFDRIREVVIACKSLQEELKMKLQLKIELLKLNSKLRQENRRLKGD